MSFWRMRMYYIGEGQGGEEMQGPALCFLEAQGYHEDNQLRRRAGEMLGLSVKTEIMV